MSSVDPIPLSAELPTNHRFVDLTGNRYGRLVVIGISHRYKRGGRVYWACLCDCGRYTDVVTCGLSSGNRLSCGCINSENTARRNYKHGLSHLRAFKSWASMVHRCAVPSDPHYADYGGRGITVCERWLWFPNFLDDMGDRPGDYEIERIDNDRGYEPDNCRWASHKEQMRNRRCIRRVTINGETLSVAEWVERLSISGTMVRNRLWRGWDPVEAITTPPFGRRGDVRDV